MENKITAVNPEKFQAFVEAQHPRLTIYGAEVAPKLLALLDKVPAYDQQAAIDMGPSDSGSYSYDWLHDEACDIVYDAMRAAGDSEVTDDNGEVEISLSIEDAVFRIADILEILYNNPKALLLQAIEMLD
jgi:hypothetical protein